VAIAGLSSGTFYPLTLTFALRNIPVRYLALTLALYATSVEGGVNFAPSLYGFCRDHLSWAWMFWTSAIITPVMLTCVYFGIPASPSRRPSANRPSFLGLLYVSSGLALVFAALDQGQRLDWWRSGLFTALFAAGIFLLLCALVRRARGPNPLVDLPYLRKWNTLILGLGLYSFRFCLLATIIVIPQTLSVRGLDAAQFGPAVLWTAAPEWFMTLFAAFLLYQRLDSRLLMAIGFTAIAAACLMNANFTSSWSAENYFRTELLMAVGQSFAFIGVVSSAVLQALFSGGLDSAPRVLTFSAFFHVVRLFGGQIGVVQMVRFIAEREKLHSFLLGLHVRPGDWLADHTVRGLTGGLAVKSSGLAAASGRAVDLVDKSIRLQAYALTFIDAFHLIAWACVAVLLLIALLRRFPMTLGELSALDAAASAHARSQG
jgi:DHA2 family multidrug resistance protein